MEEENTHVTPVPPYEVRKFIEEYVCNSDGFKPIYDHLDTMNILRKFDDMKNNPEIRGALFLVSRPFSNLNNLNKAYEEIPVIKSEKKYDWYRGHYYNIVKDTKKLDEVKNTFNGPALISNMLPPPDHLLGRFSHPSLQSESGRQEARIWKDVMGKIEAIECNIPNFFFENFEGLDKKSLKRENDRISQIYEFMKKFALNKLGEFDAPKGYPGGAVELHKRCFTLYYVKFIRDGSDKLIGYKVKWITDYTHKEKGWSKKSDKVIIKLDPYSVFIHESGMTFAGFNEKSIKKQVDEYISNK